MENTTESIHTEKQFEASVEELYDAWTNPEKLKEWWHPAGNKLVNVENDVREGGGIKYEFEGDENKKTIVITGQYKEVKPSEKLVYSWDWQMPGSDNAGENHYELTIGFVKEGEGSKLTVTQNNEDKHESVFPKEKGWEVELESLKKFLN